MSTTGPRAIVVGKINVLLASLGLLFVAGRRPASLARSGVRGKAPGRSASSRSGTAALAGDGSAESPCSSRPSAAVSSARGSVGPIGVQRLVVRPEVLGGRPLQDRSVRGKP
jgi:hypothetical protein